MKKDIWRNLVKDAPQLELIKISCPICHSNEYKTVAEGVDFEYFTCSNMFRFVQCSECQVVFLNPRPRQEDSDIIYPRHYYSFPTARGSGRHNRIVQKAWDILEQVRVKLFWKLLGKEKRKVLDLGCGSGRLLKLVKKYGYSEWKLAGIDFGLPDDFNKPELEGVKLYKGFFENIEFEEAPFDLIVAQQVIEHAYDPPALLNKIHKNLKPGGYAILDTPDFNGIDRKLFSKGYWGGYQFPRHTVLFTPETLCRLGESAGFEVIQCTKLLSPVIWILTFHHFLVGHGVPEKWAKALHYQTLPVIIFTTLFEMISIISFKWNSNMRIILRKPFN